MDNRRYEYKNLYKRGGMNLLLAAIPPEEQDLDEINGAVDEVEWTRTFHFIFSAIGVTLTALFIIASMTWVYLTL